MRKPGSGGHNKKPIIYDGKVYPSIEPLSKELNMSHNSIRYYIKNDIPLNGNYLDYAIEDSMTTK